VANNIKSQLWNLAFKRTHMSGQEFRKLLADAAKEIKRLEGEVEHYKNLYYRESNGCAQKEN